MTDELLYFPYINIPNTTWTTLSVLYWDQVHAIVPDVYQNHPNRLANNMLEMVEVGLVQQLFPYNYVCNIPNFDAAFIELTDSPEFNLADKQASFAVGNVSKIHVQKFSPHLLRELENKRILRQETWEWYYVERQTAKLFMTYLATVISGAEGFTPATDSSRNIDFKLNHDPFSYYRHATRSRFLNELIPYPIAATPYQLRDFKESFHQQLKDFRNRLEQIIIEISNINRAKDREHYYQLKLGEIIGQRDEIYARLNESRLGQIVFGTMFGLTGATIGFDAGHPLLGSFGLTNAIYSAFQGYDRGDILREDFSYLALIDKKFKITRGLRNRF